MNFNFYLSLYSNSSYIMTQKPDFDLFFKKTQFLLQKFLGGFLNQI